MVISVQQAGETQITPVDKSVHCLLAGPRDRGFFDLLERVLAGAQGGQRLAVGRAQERVGGTFHGQG